jgi:hypothetical protein
MTAEREALSRDMISRFRKAAIEFGSGDSSQHEEMIAAQAGLFAALAAHPTEQPACVAVLRYERGTPGRENEMPCVVSCDWLPDGDYPVYLAASPQPSAKGATDWQAIESTVDDYIADYEMLCEDSEGREGSYTPNERERDLIKDAVAGLLANDEFLSAFGRLSATPPTEPALTDEQILAGYRAMLGGIEVFGPDAAVAAFRAATSQAQAAPKRCGYCDDSGDVHSIDGEWRGECTGCVAALVRELDNAAARLEQRTNSPLDGLLNAAARKLEELDSALAATTGDPK